MMMMIKRMWMPWTRLRRERLSKSRCYTSGLAIDCRMALMLCTYAMYILIYCNSNKISFTHCGVALGKEVEWRAIFWYSSCHHSDHQQIAVYLHDACSSHSPHMCEQLYVSWYCVRCTTGEQLDGGLSAMRNFDVWECVVPVVSMQGGVLSFSMQATKSSVLNTIDKRARSYMQHRCNGWSSSADKRGRPKNTVKISRETWTRLHVRR